MWVLTTEYEVIISVSVPACRREERTEIAGQFIIIIFLLFSFRLFAAGQFIIIIIIVVDVVWWDWAVASNSCPPNTYQIDAWTHDHVGRSASLQ